MDNIIQLRTKIDENEQIMDALSNKLTRTPEENVQLDLLQVRTRVLYDEYWKAIDDYVAQESA